MKNFIQFHPKSFNIWLVLCKPNLEKHCLALMEVNTRKKKAQETGIFKTVPGSCEWSWR